MMQTYADPLFVAGAMLGGVGVSLFVATGYFAVQYLRQVEYLAMLECHFL